MRFIGFDGMRALACLAVIIGHALQRLDPQTTPYCLQEIHQMFKLAASSGVSVFFVLSGALLSYPFWQSYLEKAPRPSLKSYAIRRAARIMPGFYAALLAAFLLEQLFLPQLGGDAWRFLTAVTFTSGFNYNTLLITPFAGPLWTISFEVFSYVLLPLFMVGMFCFGKNRKWVTGILYWLGVLAFVFFVNHWIYVYGQPDDFQRGWQYGPLGGAKFWMPSYNPWGFFAHFSIGIFVAAILAGWQQNTSLRERWTRKYIFDAVAFLGILLCAALVWSLRYAPEFSLSLQHQPYYYPWLAISAGLVLISAPYSRFAGKLLDNGFFRYTAKVSFGLYVWHFVIMMLLLVFAGYNYGSVPFARWVRLTAVALLLAYGIASVSWFYMEKPILHWARRQSDPHTKRSHENSD